jgi:hypothetical protein
MTTVQTIGVVIGVLIIVTVLWNLIRKGIARSNGKVETFDFHRNTDWLGP